MKHLDVHYDVGTIDVSVIGRFEHKIDYRFPESYKQLLCEHNQLMPKESWFDFRNIYDAEDVRDVTFLGYGETSIEK